MILRVDANLKQEIIVITADKARLCLRDAVDNMERSKAWQTPAGILATILVVFPVSTFQDFLGFSKDTWKALFIAAALFFVGWLILSAQNQQVSHRRADCKPAAHCRFHTAATPPRTVRDLHPGAFGALVQPSGCD
jgi:hypothetical protein